MCNYKRDDYEEIAEELAKLVHKAQTDAGDQSPQIDIEDAKALISQYSPDSVTLKKAMFENVHFCLYCGILIFDQSADDMFRVSDFIRENHNAYSVMRIKP
tara:strand:+ start:194 stop:496 length:303 start_codon:yes stop_codon:yes gene_type:complete